MGKRTWKSDAREKRFARDGWEASNKNKRRGRELPSSEALSAKSALIEEGLRLQREKSRQEQELRKQEQEQELDAQRSSSECLSRDSEVDRRAQVAQLCRSIQALSWTPFPGYCGESSSSPCRPPVLTVAGSLPKAVWRREIGLPRCAWSATRLHLLARNLPVLQSRIHTVNIDEWIPHRYIQSNLSCDLVYHPLAGALVATHGRLALYPPFSSSSSSEPTPSTVICVGTNGSVPRSSAHCNLGVTRHGAIHACFFTKQLVELAQDELDFSLDTVRDINGPLGRHQFRHTFSPYSRFVDASTVSLFARNGESIFLTSCREIHRVMLNTDERLSYQFGRKKCFDHARIGGERASITCLYHDDLLPGGASGGSNTLFAGSRNGSIHHLDFRQPASSQAGEVHSFSTRQMRFAIHSLETLPYHHYSLVASDICNEIAIFDIRKLCGRPMQTLQPGSPNGVNQTGFWLSPDNKLLVSQWNDGKKGPIHLAYYSTDAAFARIGDPIPFLLNDSEQYGSIKFARNVGHAIDEPCGRDVLPEVWGMYSPARTVSELGWDSQGATSVTQLFTMTASRPTAMDGEQESRALS